MKPDPTEWHTHNLQGNMWLVAHRFWPPITKPEEHIEIAAALESQGGFDDPHTAAQANRMHNRHNRG